MVKIVIIGGGIAGLSAATLLGEHSTMEIDIYEKEERIGGQAASMYNSNCNIEHCWRIFGINYHNMWYILKNILNIMEKFTPFKDACIIDNDIGTPFDRITFNSYFPMIFKTVKLLDYYKYFDFLFLSKERVIKNYDHMNALEYFDENPMVKTMIGPILGLEIDKLSVSGIFENLYHMMDGTKYYFTPNISQVTKEPTQEAVFSHWEKHLLNKHIPIHKNQALEDICIEDNKIKYVVLNSKKVYADEFIFACSLKPLNHILEKKPPCETFRNMKQLEQNLQLFFAFNIYFNKKIIMNCESFNLQEEPWQHTIQRKVNWPDDVIRKCKYDNKKVEEVWNVSIIDLVKGKKYKKTPRECSLEEAVEETIYQLKTNAFIMKTMKENHVTFEDVYLGYDIWYQHVNSNETFPLHKDSSIHSKIADLNPKYSPNQGTMKYVPETHPNDIPENMALCGYYVQKSYGGASMEASCETGLIAADYLLQKHKISNQTILPIKHTNKYLTSFPLFKPFIKLDELLYENKLDPITKYINSFYLFLCTLLLCIVIMCLVFYKGIKLYTSNKPDSKSLELSIKKGKLSRSFKRLKR